jgi:ComF family protein
MESAFARVLRVFCDAVFPPRCHACGAWMPAGGGKEAAFRGASEEFAQRFDGLLCPECMADFTPVETPFCELCGVPFAGRAGEDHLCGRCLARPPVFYRARASGIYDSALLSLIHGFKYRSRTELARPLAGLLLDAFHRFWKRGEIDGVVAVPLHPRRLRDRGFNQAELLIRCWKGCADPRGAPGPLLPDALVRGRFTAPQTGLGRRERAENIRGAFSLGPNTRVEGMHLLLVDDVLTTGATAQACSRVLTRAGAGRVGVLTLARSVAGD